MQCLISFHTETWNGRSIDVFFSGTVWRGHTPWKNVSFPWVMSKLLQEVTYKIGSFEKNKENNFLCPFTLCCKFTSVSIHLMIWFPSLPLSSLIRFVMILKFPKTKGYGGVRQKKKQSKNYLSGKYQSFTALVCTTVDNLHDKNLITRSQVELRKTVEKVTPCSIWQVSFLLFS